MRLRLLAVGMATIVVLAGCSDSGTPAGEGIQTASSTATSAPKSTPTTTSTTSTTTEPPATFDGVDQAMDVIDVWNSGDFDAWLAYWDADPDDSLLHRSVMNSHERMEVTAPCEVISEASDRVVVTCSIFVEDDFHGAGGLTSNGIATFYFDGSGLITDMGSTTYEDTNGNCCPEWAAFSDAFHRWLQDAHPDVYAEIGPKAGTPLWYLPGFASGNADHMLVALQYVDEFVAQSDDYPLGG